MSCAAVASSDTASMRLPIAVRVRMRCSSSVIAEPDRAGQHARALEADALNTKESPTSVSGRVLKLAPKYQKAA